MHNFINYLNAHSHGFVLKDSTALMFCYGLTRFSEDIDLDVTNKKDDITIYINNFCKAYNYKYRTAKDTDTVKRFFIHYENNADKDDKPLKIEVSYRKLVAQNEYKLVNGILVYSIENLCAQKLSAYYSRDRLRDLYDVVFIFKNYISVLPEGFTLMFKSALAFKGLGYFDYIIKTQHDDLVDNNELANNFLDVYYYLGLS